MKKYIAALIITILTILIIIGLYQHFRPSKEEPTTPATKPITCTDVDTSKFALAKPNQELTRKASLELASLTKQIVTTINTSANINSLAQDPQFSSVLQKRKDLLVETFYRNPYAAIFSILTGKNKTLLQQISTNCIEDNIEATGITRTLTADFTDGTSATDYKLIVDDNPTYSIHPAVNLNVSLESGTEVKIRGVIIDKQIIFNGTKRLSDPLDFTGGVDIIKTPGNPPVIGDQLTKVIAVYFQDTPDPPPSTWTIQELSDLVFVNVNNYYKESSYNIMSQLYGETVGWIPLSIDTTCDFDTIYNLTIFETDSQIDYTGTDRIMIYTPLEGCDWDGMSTFGKIPIPTLDGTIDTSIAVVDENAFRIDYVTSHELGHGFGLGHAAFLDCGNDPLDSGSCFIDEYGDLYDVMGDSQILPSLPHNNSPHKETLAWLLPSNITNVTTNGTYSVEPIETTTAGIKALRIPRNADEDFWVEYRQPIGTDVGMDSFTNVYEGALIHTTGSYPGYIDTLLIDATFPHNDKHAAILPVGEVFDDPASDVTIETLSISPTELVVQVTLSPDTTPPTVTLTEPLDGAIVSGTINVTATATDDTAIDRVEFYRSCATPPCVAFAIETTPIAPDTYQTTLDTSSLPPGNYTLWAVAYDTNGNNTSSTFVNITVLPAAPTSTPTPFPTPTSTPPPTPTTAPGAVNLNCAGRVIDTDGNPVPNVSVCIVPHIWMRPMNACVDPSQCIDCNLNPSLCDECVALTDIPGIWSYNCNCWPDSWEIEWIEFTAPGYVTNIWRPPPGDSFNCSVGDFVITPLGGAGWNCVDPDADYPEEMCVPSPGGTWRTAIDCLINCRRWKCIGPYTCVPCDIDEDPNICRYIDDYTCGGECDDTPPPIPTPTPIPAGPPRCDPPGYPVGSGAGVDTAIGCIPVITENTQPFVTFILRWAFNIAGGSAFLLILYAGSQILTSAGNPRKVAAGKELLTAAIAGLILLLFSVFVLETLGVRILQLPKF